MNTVVVVGRVGRDASENFNAYDSGKTKASFSVAVNRWDTKTKSEVTDWFNIEVWDKQAEFAAEYIKKADLLQLMEELQIDAGLISKQTTKEKLSMLLQTTLDY